MSSPIGQYYYWAQEPAQWPGQMLVKAVESDMVYYTVFPKWPSWKGMYDREVPLWRFEENIESGWWMLALDEALQVSEGL